MHKQHLTSNPKVELFCDMTRVKAGGGGSTSPTPALPFTPTPSPSPFNPLSPSVATSLPELNIPLPPETKSLSFVQDAKLSGYPHGRSSFFEMDLERNRSPGTSKYSFLSSPPLNANNQPDVVGSLPNYSSLEIPSVLSFPEANPPLNNISVNTNREKIKSYIVVDRVNPIVSSPIPLLSQQDTNNIDSTVRLVDVSATAKNLEVLPVNVNSPTVEVIPKSESRLPIVSELQPCLSDLGPVSACITALPNVTRHQITCMSGLSTPVTKHMTGITAVSTLPRVVSMNCLNSSSSPQTSPPLISNSFHSYPTAVVHPKKKQRLLTFLSNDNNGAMCDVSKSVSTIIDNSSHTSTSDAYLLSSNGQSIMTVTTNSPTILLNGANEINSVVKPEPTVYFNESQNSLVSVEPKNSSSTIYLNAGSELSTVKETSGVYVRPGEGVNKNESAIIINSDGTQATLITPVSNGPQQLITSVTEAGANIINSESVAPSNLVSSHLVESAHISKSFSSNSVITAPTVTFRPMVNTANLNVETLEDSRQNLQNNDVVPVDLLALNFSVKQPTEGEKNSVCLMATNGQSDKQVEMTADLATSTSVDDFYESVNILRCKLCSFIALDRKKMFIHFADDHEDKFPDGESEVENWVAVAQREGVKLNCPFCANLFTSERSFKVHLIEDHANSEASACRKLELENMERKKTVDKILKAERERRKEERRKTSKGKPKPYLDGKGEIIFRIRPSDASRQSDGFNLCNYKMNGWERDDECSAFSLTTPSKMDSDKARNAFPKESQNKKSVNNSNTNVIRPTNKAKGSLTYSCIEERCGIQNCSMKFKDSENLRLHRLSHDRTAFQCPQCKNSFSSWNKCALHLWKVHRLDLELLSCGSCGYRCSRPLLMERHELKHCKKKPALCPLCGKSFESDKNLKIHFQSTHEKLNFTNPKSSKVCDLCQKMFCSLREVKYHKARVHSKLKPWICTHCSHAASSRHSLQLHIRTHLGVKPFSCTECEYRTGDHNSLRRHAMRHSGERPYRCPFCPYSSIQSTTYRAHIRKRHPDTIKDSLYQCELCQFKSDSEKSLMAHMRSHTSLSDGRSLDALPKIHPNDDIGFCSADRPPADPLRQCKKLSNFSEDDRSARNTKSEDGQRPMKMDQSRKSQPQKRGLGRSDTADEAVDIEKDLNGR